MELTKKDDGYYDEIINRLVDEHENKSKGVQ